MTAWALWMVLWASGNKGNEYRFWHTFNSEASALVAHNTDYVRKQGHCWMISLNGGSELPILDDKGRCADIENPDVDQIDTPATTRKQLTHPKGESYPCGMFMACIANEDVYIDVPTCSDRARILEHDEQTPPKYWCRKVQP